MILSFVLSFVIYTITGGNVIALDNKIPETPYELVDTSDLTSDFQNFELQFCATETTLTMCLGVLLKPSCSLYRKR